MSLLSFTKKLSRKGGDDKKDALQPQQPHAARVPSATRLHSLAPFLEPVLSEKSVALQEQGVATFRVPQSANKHQVALAVMQRYGVRVRQVRLVPVLPRRRRRGTTAGFTRAGKKAYVAVDDVQKIVTGP